MLPLMTSVKKKLKDYSLRLISKILKVSLFN
jgi:hypothetical protein